MLHYPTKELSPKQWYKFISGSIVPRPIAWVTTRNAQTNRTNAAPFSFFSGLSSDLPLATLAVTRRDGTVKDTAQNILETNELVLHFVNEAVLTLMNETAASFPADESEIDYFSIATVPSKTVAVPGIQQALIRMEAKLYDYHPITSPDGLIVSDLFIVEITDFYFDESVIDQEKGYLLSEVLQPIARLAGNNYTKVTDTFELTRPD